MATSLECEKKIDVFVVFFLKNKHFNSAMKNNFSALIYTLKFAEYLAIFIAHTAKCSARFRVCKIDVRSKIFNFLVFKYRICRRDLHNIVNSISDVEIHVRQGKVKKILSFVSQLSYCFFKKMGNRFLFSRWPIRKNRLRKFSI